MVPNNGIGFSIFGYYSRFFGTGAQGPQGPQGLTGATGAVGAQGPSGYPFGGGTFTGSIVVNGTVTAHDFIGSSDERLKENICDLRVSKIQTCYKTYRFKEDLNREQRVGVLAQELERWHPEFVKTDENDQKSVRYIDLHSAEIAYLKQELQSLKELYGTYTKHDSA